MAAAPLSDLAAVLQSMFLGSNKSTTETTTGTARADAPILERLQSLFDEAMTNSRDPKAVQPVVDKIMRDAQIAFAPQLGREASAGLYNSTTRNQIANQATADAAGAVSGAVLNYKTGQQQIANQAGNTLASNARTTTGAGNQRAVSPPALGQDFSKLAMTGLGAYSLFKQKDKIADWLTGGTTVAGTPADYATFSTAANDLLAPLDFLSGGTSAFSSGATPFVQAADELLAPLDFLGGGSTEIANFFTGEDIAGLTDAFDFGGFDITDTIMDFSGFDLGFDITDIFSGIGDFGGTIFDEILRFF